MAALAPNEPRNGPTIPHAPSYVKIGEEIYDPDNDNEPQRRSILHFITNGHEFRK
jgi:hypothetical protein